MSATLEKVKRLERYIAGDDASIDPVLDMTIDKLLTREINRIEELQRRLTKKLAEYEKKYGIDSGDFNERFKSGEMGDATDYIELAATLQMLENANRQLSVLEKDTD